MELEIIHDKQNHQFSVTVEGKEAQLTYHMQNADTINFDHTYVPSELRGQGIAAKIVKTGLDFARENDFQVIPSCSYVDAYVRRHEEYQNILK